MLDLQCYSCLLREVGHTVPIELKDVSFTVLILVMTAFMYHFFRDVALAFFSLIFLGISYLEAETGRLTISVKKGKLKLKGDQIPEFREYYDIVKWWAPVTLTLAFGLTSFVFVLRGMPGVHLWVLLTLFMYATSMITFSFTLFLSELIKKKAIAKQIALNSLFIWLFAIVTGSISGSVASLFGISLFEDLIVAIAPLLIYELFRLNFIRNAIFSVTFSSIEQAVRLLSLAEKQYVPGDPFLKKLRSMKKKIDVFLKKTIILKRQQSEILSDLNSRKRDLGLEIEKNSGIAPALPQNISELQALKREGENLELNGPFFLGDKFFYSAYYSCRNTKTGFSVFELKSRSLVSNHKTAEKIAMCTAILARTREHKRSTKAKLLAYFTRFKFLMFDVLHKVFRWSFVRNVSNWISKFDEFERAKNEGSIGLDMTALLNYLADRSIDYIDFALLEFEEFFLKLHSYPTASSIIEYKKRELALFEEQLEIWAQRVKAAEIVPLEVYGTGYLRRSSAKKSKEIAVRSQQIQKWLVSLQDETQNLLDILRVVS